MATIVERKGKSGKTYRAIVRISGRPTKTRTFKRKTDATLWAQQEEAAVRSGEVLDVAKEARNRTVKELFQEYRATVLTEKTPSWQCNVETCLKWWEARLGAYSLSAVTPRMIEAGLAELRGEGDTRWHSTAMRVQKPKSRRTIKFYRDCLEWTFRSAVQWRWLAKNPLGDVSRITKIRNERTRFLSDDELTRLLASCRESKNPFLYLIVLFAVSTGARRGEILKLTLADVDLEQERAILRHTKNSETRSVPLKGRLKEELKRHIEEIEWRYAEDFGLPPKWLFPGIDGTAPIQIKTAWENAREGADLEDFRFHDLRHTAASYLAREGATLLEIAAVLGHRTLQMVQRYAHLTDQHTAAVVERMNARVFSDT